ncbi:putative monooxygenase [Exophiala viscosa]|uniref:Monooxygenase n=1 Tax=Exophiala viscosa TaxID=2486360 RepID=A0AAN6ICN2_9EURO|nr:putative monooxygenase [Exophiala viscosa]
MASKPVGHFLQGKRIIVAGGGIVGAIFVAALDQLWDSSLPRPVVTVFEREKSREASVQQDPYTLTLNGGNQDEGLVALQQLGLLEKVRSAPSTILNSGVIMVWSDSWKYLASINPKPHQGLPAATMRITRQHLKDILLDRTDKESAKKITVDWRHGCTCTRAERLSSSTSGPLRVTIADRAQDGSDRSWTQNCDLLIVADGPDSIGGISRLPSGLPRPIHEDYGLQMSSGEGVCCIYTPFDDTTVGWALSKKGEPRREAKVGYENEPKAFDVLKTEALKTASMFQEPFRTVVEATDPATAFVRPAMEKHPFRHDTATASSPLLGTSGAVVFIGDANHTLNPYVLDGANLALKDGWDLAEQMCRNSHSIEAAVDAYDKLSVPRAQHVIHFSKERIRFGHSTGLTWKVYKYGMAAQRAMAKKD